MLWWSKATATTKITGDGRMLKAILNTILGRTNKAIVKGNPALALDVQINQMLNELAKTHEQIIQVQQGKVKLEYKLKELENKLDTLIKNIKLAKQSDSEHSIKLQNNLAESIMNTEMQIESIKQSLEEVAENYNEGIKIYEQQKQAIENAKSKKALLVSKLEVAKMRKQVAETKVEFTKGGSLKGIEKIEEIIADVNAETEAIKTVAKDTTSKFDEFEATIEEQARTERLKDILNRY